jgi:SAM-dependent methyltransferase
MQLAKKRLKEFAKRVAFRYTSLGAPSYPYNLEPIQLAMLVTELDRLRDVRGTIVEVGVARGMTTRFICEHLAMSKPNDIRMVVIDTFTSFKKDDLAHEVKHRGKSPDELEAFGFNDFEVWKKNFAGFPWLTAYQADCAEFDFRTIAPIKLALLDVDLYLPTRAALRKIYEALAPGGVILIDDVIANSGWDGAHQAYHEFCVEHGLSPQVVGNKCGVLRK